MSLPADIDVALRRLNMALDQFEASVHRRGQIEAARGNLEEELALLQDDRSRLAVELDGALARAKTLTLANQEVARRLGRASSTIRMVLGEADAAS